VAGVAVTSCLAPSACGGDGDGDGETSYGSSAGTHSGDIRDTCAAFNANDPLLGSMRPLCPVQTTFSDQLSAVQACRPGTPVACLARVRQTRRTVRLHRRLSRRADRAVERSEPSRACKQVLVTPPAGCALFASVERAMTLQERGLQRGSEADLERAQDALAGPDDAAEPPTAKRILTTFRRACD